MFHLAGWLDGWLVGQFVGRLVSHVSTAVACFEAFDTRISILTYLNIKIFFLITHFESSNTCKHKTYTTLNSVAFIHLR